MILFLNIAFTVSTLGLIFGLIWYVSFRLRVLFGLKRAGQARAGSTSTSTPVTPNSFIAEKLSGFLVHFKRSSRQATTHGFDGVDSVLLLHPDSVAEETTSPATP